MPAWRSSALATFRTLNRPLVHRVRHREDAAHPRREHFPSAGRLLPQSTLHGAVRHRRLRMATRSDRSLGELCRTASSARRLPEARDRQRRSAGARAASWAGCRIGGLVGTSFRRIRCRVIRQRGMPCSRAPHHVARYQVHRLATPTRDRCKPSPASSVTRGSRSPVCLDKPFLRADAPASRRLDRRALLVQRLAVGTRLLRCTTTCFDCSASLPISAR